MSETIPTWLKAMQNGSLGEARAKAFLMDRFWILERSVDIEGADLIIQRRLTGKNLLDKTPPRLGFVQVKFFESEKTTQYIPTAYILDRDGKSREDFFVLFFSGYEENAKINFLTADTIFKSFETVEVSGIAKFKIPGSAIVNTDKYLVKSNSNTLSRIEHHLEMADFRKNREFISWKLPGVLGASSSILPVYREKIENRWGDIPEEFKRIKEGALKAMKEVEEIYLQLKTIAEEIDPLEAFSKIEELKWELDTQTYGSWGRGIMNSLYDEDFYYTCRNHKDRVETLQKDGLLDDYVSAQSVIVESVVGFISQHLPLDANTIHSMIVKFSTRDFKIESIRHKIIKASAYFNIPETLNQYGHVDIPHDKYDGINIISTNSFEYYWLAGRIHIEEQYRNNLTDFYRDNVYSIYRDILDKMYDLKYNNR